MANKSNDADNFRTSVLFIGKHIDPSARVVFIVIGSLMILSAVFGNFTLLFIVVKHFKRNPKKFLQDMFIANLALDDLLVLGYWFTFFVLDLNIGYHPVVNGLHCTANGMIIAILHGVGMNSLVTISFNRYLHVCHPHLYRRVFTLPKTVCWCLLIWVITALLALPPLWGGAAGTYQYNAVNHICSYGRKGFTYPKVMAIVYTVFPPFFLAYFNFAIFRFWRKARLSLTKRYPLVKAKEQQRRGKLTSTRKGGAKSAKTAILGRLAAEPSQEQEQNQERRGCAAVEHPQGQEQKQIHAIGLASQSHAMGSTSQSHAVVLASQSHAMGLASQSHAMGLASQSHAIGSTTQSPAIEMASQGRQVAAICLLKQQGKLRALSKSTDDTPVSFNVKRVTQLPRTPKGDNDSGSELKTPTSRGVHVQDVTNDEDSDDSRTDSDTEWDSAGVTVESQEEQPDDCFSSKTEDPSDSTELQETTETYTNDDKSELRTPTEEETGVETNYQHHGSDSNVTTQKVSMTLSEAPPSRRRVKQRMSSTRRRQQNAAVQRQQQRLRKKHQSKEEALVRSLIVVSVLMYIALLPYTIVIIVDSQVKQSVEVHIAVCTLLFCNNSVNWVVYGVMNQAFRKGYATCFRKILNVFHP